MIRQLLWFALGWGGPVPLHTYSGIEYLIAFGGGGVALAFYPVWFRMGFGIVQRGKQARIGAWAIAVALAGAWGLLALDLLLFNTTLIVVPLLCLAMVGVLVYLWVHRI